MCQLRAVSVLCMHPNTDTVCTLIVRGEAFRHGGHKSRLLGGHLSTQINALRSLRRHLVDNLEAVGWTVRLAFDVACGSRAAEFVHALKRANLRAHALRTSISLANRPQPANVRRSCEWAYHACGASASSLVVLTRIDMRWKRSPFVPIPQPTGLAKLGAGASSVVALWDCVPRQHAPERRLVNDVLFYMPGATLPAFKQALQELAARDESHMHNLPAVFIGAVRVMHPEHINANPQRRRNDCYRLIGRPEAASPPRARARAECAQRATTVKIVRASARRTPENRRALVLQLMR